MTSLRTLLHSTPHRTTHVIAHYNTRPTPQCTAHYSTRPTHIITNYSTRPTMHHTTHTITHHITLHHTTHTIPYSVVLHHTTPHNTAEPTFGCCVNEHLCASRVGTGGGEGKGSPLVRMYDRVICNIVY